MLEIRTKPRSYQKEALEIVQKKLSSKVTSQLIVMATGLGKTFVATQIKKQMDNGSFVRCLFIAHREELIMQAYEAFDVFFPMQVGIIKAERRELDKPIVIGSVQTLTNMIDEFKKNQFDLIIIDEAHHYMAPSYLKVANYFEHKLKIGLTATPERFDGLSLSNVFDEIVYNFGIDKGIQEGWLCELQGIRIQTDIDISKIKKVGGDFNKKELSNAVDTPIRNQLVVQKYQQFANNRQAVFFCVDMLHAKHLCDQFKANNIEAEFIVSDETMCPNRTELVEKFKAGKIPVVTNVMILTEGFDYPDIGAIGMVRPTQSKTVYIQSIGRGTRIKSPEFIDRHGANNCVILDFVDNCGKHKLVNTFSLDQGKTLEEKTFMTTKRREILIKKRDEQKERRQRTIDKMYSKDKQVDLLRLPNIVVYQNRGRMKEDATPKQIDWLKSIGVWREGITFTKGQASELITNFPAKEWQIRKLAEWGYDVRDGATQGQYYDIKRSREEAREEKEGVRGSFRPFV